MKGIVLAGGTGSRLYPLTIAVSKQLLPIYDKPMIYYPISILMYANIKEILIITTPEDQNSFKKLLGDGSDIGCKFEYAIQDKPNGLAEAFIIGEEFIGKDSVALILGDNIFYGTEMIKILDNNFFINTSTVFAIEVNNPSRYGVVEFNKNNKVISIEEKPKEPKSNFAVPGLYFYTNDVISISKKIKPSKRGELEITAINNYYLEMNKLEVCVLPRGITWLDAGTPNSLSDANEFVEVIENRMGIKIACIEEIAYKKKFITKNQFENLISKYEKSEYSKYLKKILK